MTKEIFDNCLSCKRFAVLSGDKTCMTCKVHAQAKSGGFNSVKRFGRPVNSELNEDTIITLDHLTGD